MWQVGFRWFQRLERFWLLDLLQIELDVFCRDWSSSVHSHRFKIAVRQRERGLIACPCKPWKSCSHPSLRDVDLDFLPHGLPARSRQKNHQCLIILYHFGFSSLFGLTRKYRKLLPNVLDVLICKAALKEAQWREDAVMHELLREQQDPSTWQENDGIEMDWRIWRIWRILAT